MATTIFFLSSVRRQNKFKHFFGAESNPGPAKKVSLNDRHAPPPPVYLSCRDPPRPDLVAHLHYLCCFFQAMANKSLALSHTHARTHTHTYTNTLACPFYFFKRNQKMFKICFYSIKASSHITESIK